MGRKETHNLPPLYENFHKFAAECLPGRVIFYFDDVSYFSIYSQSYPTHPMRVVIDNQLQVYPKDFVTNGIPVTPWPIYYVVDYFHYYQLNMDYCGTDATINSNSDLTSFQYGVRRNITIGNGSSSISLNTGDNITFRATNGVTINGNFTVPVGSTLNIIPTPCQ